MRKCYFVQVGQAQLGTSITCILGGRGGLVVFLGFLFVWGFFFSFTCNTQTEVNSTEVCAGMTSVAATRVAEVKDEEGFEGLVLLLNL